MLIINTLVLLLEEKDAQGLGTERKGGEEYYRRLNRPSADIDSYQNATVKKNSRAREQNQIQFKMQIRNRMSCTND